MRKAIFLPLFLLGLILLNCSRTAPNKSLETWQHYLGDPHRTHFSTLTQIDTSNVASLELAWSYSSGGLDENRTTQIQTNPLIIGNYLYGVNAALELFAVNAKTGKELWVFSPNTKDNSGLGLNRGLAYWHSNNEEPHRLFFSSGSKLYAIDITTGKPITSFGHMGNIDLRNGLGRDPNTLSVVANTPGAIYQNLLIMGTRVGEGPGSSPGHIRAYNVLNGEIAWTFNTIPLPDEYGYDTWPKNAFKAVGGANSWAGIAIDDEHGIAYVPTGSAAFDWYGGDRHGANLFANCLLALDATTGERKWHFQFVHHDLWDRDLPAPPNLFSFKKNGEVIPAVAQVTKSGHVFIFDRITGEPLFPINEKSYPPSKLKGELAYPTQPLPVKPKPFARQRLVEKDLYDPNRSAFVDDFVDKEQNINPPSVLEKFKSISSEGQFIPIDTSGVLLYPGADGGAEWGGAAVDPRNGTMYVNSNEMAWIVRMKEVKVDGSKNTHPGEVLTQVHCARCHGGELLGLTGIPELKTIKERMNIDSINKIIKNGRGAMPGMPNLKESEIAAISSYISGEVKIAEDHRMEPSNIEVPYSVAGFGRFKDNRGFPVVKPPWGTLNALNLNSGEYLWKIPLGNDEQLNDPDYPISGTENYGGPVITKGGVLFIAATKDEKIRAFSMTTGEQLWEDKLPSGGYATPSTYKIDGKQYLVIACGGGKMGTKSGDQYLAYSLPD